MIRIKWKVARSFVMNVWHFIAYNVLKRKSEEKRKGSGNCIPKKFYRRKLSRNTRIIQYGKNSIFIVVINIIKKFYGNFIFIAFIINSFIYIFLIKSNQFPKFIYKIFGYIVFTLFHESNIALILLFNSRALSCERYIVRIVNTRIANFEVTLIDELLLD